MPAIKQQIRQIIADSNLSSVADVYSLLRESFKDILQELMEAGLDASLGYEKNQKGEVQTSNKRNGHFPKTLKSQYGEFQIDVPRDREGEFEPRFIPKYQKDISGIEEKVISLYARGMSTRQTAFSALPPVSGSGGRSVPVPRPGACSPRPETFFHNNRSRNQWPLRLCQRSRGRTIGSPGW